MKIFLSFTILLTINSTMFAQNSTVKEASYKNDDIILFADIFIPNTPREEKIGISIIQGSGNSDRTNLWSRSFAEFLAENGFFVLLPDKRGCGKSQGDWKTSSFQDLAADVISSVTYLKETEKLNKIGVMGLSQGGFIAPIAASQDTSINFVINIVGASVTLEEQIIHEVTNTARKKGLTPNEIKEVLELHILMKEYALNRDWEPLGNKFKELENSNWAEFAKTFPNNPDIWIWDWIKMNINFDPMEYWNNVKQDVFIAYGSKDQEDNMPVYESVYRLQNGFKNNNKTNYQLNIYQTGHSMYEDDKAELRKEFLNDLLMWFGY